MIDAIPAALAAAIAANYGWADADSSFVLDTFSSPLAESPDPNCPSSPTFGDVAGLGIAGIRSIETFGTCVQPEPVMVYLPEPPADGAVRAWLGSYGFVSSEQSVRLRYRKFGETSLVPLSEVVIEGGGETRVTEGLCCEGVASVTVELMSVAGNGSATKIVNGTSGLLRFPLADFAGSVDLSAVTEVAITFRIGPGQDYCDNGGPFGPCFSIAVDWTIDRLFILSPSDVDGDFVADAIDNCPLVQNPSQADCDRNGVGDACELAAGAPDFNVNGVPDSCECIADLFIDGQVNGADLGALLSQWGAASATTVSDLNRDGQVNGADLGYLLANWGPCPS